MKNILIITEKLSYVCGVSNHIKNLVNGFEQDYNNKFIILCGSAESYELIKEFKCKVIVNDVISHSKRSILNFMKSTFFIKSLILKNKIDIVHSHNHYASNLAFYASRFTKTRTMQTNHGIIQDIGRLGHFKADYHIVLSKRIKDYLVIEKKLDPQKIFIIHQGLFNTREKNQKISSNKLIILAASRYDANKSLDLYVKAANIIGMKYTHICDFYIAGDGEEKDSLLHLNNSLGGVVKFINPVNEFRDLLPQVNIFVFTSSADEGIPIVIMEALINNCLVVSSSYKGYKDIFPDELSNMIFVKGDLQNLKEKMEYSIINYKALIEKYVPLYESILEEFKIERMLFLHNILYQRANDLSALR